MDTIEAQSFNALLAAGGTLIADGATGTNYQTMGMEPGLAPEGGLHRSRSRERRRRLPYRVAGQTLWDGALHGVDADELGWPAVDVAHVRDRPLLTIDLDQRTLRDPGREAE